MRTFNLSSTVVHLPQTGLPITWQASGGPVVPYAPVNTGRLWVGLTGPADWSTEQLPLNLVKMARAWVGQTGTGWGQGTPLLQPLLDADGYVTQMPPTVQTVATVLLTDQPQANASILNGHYHFRWSGSGTVAISGAGISNVTTTAPNHIEFDYAIPVSGSVYIDITSITQGNHPRNFSIVRSDHLARYAAGYITRPSFYFDDAQVFRFMDLQGTNNSVITGLSNYNTPNCFSWAVKGMSIQEIVQICNETGASPWINIPHLADDALVSFMATYVRDNLNPALKCYIEWSNEIWNFIFSQATYCVQQGQNIPGAGATGYLQYAGARASQCMNIVSSVFAGQMNRVVRVAGVFTGAPGQEAALLDAPNWVALGNQPPVNSFDAIAVAGYFSAALFEDSVCAELLNQITTNGEAAAATWLTARLDADAATEGSLAELFAQWDAFRAMCDARGLDLLMYEGGDHLTPSGTYNTNSTVMNFLHSYSYSAQAGINYHRILERWDTVGDGSFTQFVTFGPPGQHGQFGAVRHIGDDGNPRAAKLLQYNAAPLPPLTAPGTPVGARRVDAYGYINSLNSHADPSSEQNPSTRAPNWIARFAAAAPNGGNIYTLGARFSGVNQWAANPTPDGSTFHEDVSNPWINGDPPDWVNAEQIEVVEFTPNNFDMVNVDPNVASGIGPAVQSTILGVVDAWQTNGAHPTPANRIYAVYAGWPLLSGYGSSTVAGMTPTMIANWIAYGLGPYQAWLELLVSRLQAARPALNFRLQNVSRACLLAYRDTAVSTIPITSLFEDMAPHGRASWYCLAGIAHYIELFNEKPPANFAFNPAWNVHPTFTANYQAIVDHIWSVLRP